jgi:hypothetical protein
MRTTVWPESKAMNAMAGLRIAEVSVHRFITDVAGYLRQALPWVGTVFLRS